MKALLISGISWLKISVRIYNPLNQFCSSAFTFSLVANFLFGHVYILNCADGDGGRKAGSCPNRAESSPLNDKSKSLVLVNYFRSVPIKPITCEDNSGELINMIHTCYGAAGNRWANFVAVDYYKVGFRLVLFSSSKFCC